MNQNPVYNPSTADDIVDESQVSSFYSDVPEPSVNNYLNDSAYNDNGYMDVSPETNYLASDTEL